MTNDFWSKPIDEEIKVEEIEDALEVVKELNKQVDELEVAIAERRQLESAGTTG